jgi:catechol 2,3-dioxygenase-like lactoylglutathione lyase family enzyme
MLRVDRRSTMPTTVDEIRQHDGARLDAITIEVKDVRRSVELLRSLGVALAPAGAGESFTSRRAPEFRVDWTVATSAPLDIRLGVRCGKPADVDRLTRLFCAAGHRLRRGPTDESWGSRAALLVDPDGHLIELYAPYP